MNEFNCFYESLKFDEACVNVIFDNNNYNMWLYSLSTDCLSVSTIVTHCVLYIIIFHL